ncbi:SMC family ATPase [Prochlorothrix hollandica]|uniref:SMC family ATPase n=1 Tax=Prochlorothrix hollandica TaxID=1223 RepID=UPI0033424545
MEILSVSLRDFKIHHDRYFEFAPGVNAICGENGAGKTSILEAIAWVLFNSSGDYRKEELRRQGSSSTQVTVRLLSAADGRTYDVQRQSGKSKADSYTIYDPQLNTKVEGIHRLEDAEQWLRQHLGIANGSDLSKLFGDIIGIPQGTFTADFLKKPGDRRKVFDPILQVEEYKQTFQSSLGLEKYAQRAVETTAQALGLVEERLQDWDSLRHQEQQVAQAVAEGEAAVTALTAELDTAQRQWQGWKAQGDALQQIQQTLALLQQQQQQWEQTRSHQAQALDQAQTAADRWHGSRAGFEAYQQLTQSLHVLAGQRSQRDSLRQQGQELGSKQQRLAVQTAQLQAQLAQISQLRQHLTQVEAQIPQQETLETQFQTLQQQLQHHTALATECRGLEQQLAQYQQRQTQIHQNLAPLAELAAIAATLPQLEQDYQASQARRSYGAAAQEFEQQLRHMVNEGRQQWQHHQGEVQEAQTTLDSAAAALPLWSGPLTAVHQTLATGAQLHGNLLESLDQTILVDLAHQGAGGGPGTDRHSQLRQLEQRRQEAQAAQLRVVELETQRSTLGEVEGAIAQLQSRLAELRQGLGAMADLQGHYGQIQQQLTNLGDPRRQAQGIRQQLSQGANIEQQLHQLQAQDADLAAQQAQLTQALVPFADLDHHLATQEHQRSHHEADYVTHLQQESSAHQLPHCRQVLERTEGELTQLAQTLAQTQAQYDAAQGDWDPAQLHRAEETYQRLQAQRGQWLGALPEKRREWERLQGELQQRQQWAAEGDRLTQDLHRKTAIAQFITEARRVYNQSGSRITGFYLDEIRREGDRLFRELMNRQGVALTWTDDYEIQVQEEKGWRGFRTLSGGEQMAAALAVRLALLKVLAELDVAFFDEPTTNMDRDRREQLAEALGNLKTFRQLFIISHDDTFEHLTENVIRVERVVD